MSGNGHKSGKQAEDARDPLKNHHSHINAIFKKKKQKRWMLISWIQTGIKQRVRVRLNTAENWNWKLKNTVAK